jgi:hypothetical protein
VVSARRSCAASEKGLALSPSVTLSTPRWRVKVKPARRSGKRSCSVSARQRSQSGSHESASVRSSFNSRVFRSIVVVAAAYTTCEVPPLTSLTFR